MIDRATSAQGTRLSNRMATDGRTMRNAIRSYSGERIHGQHVVRAHPQFLPSRSRSYFIDEIYGSGTHGLNALPVFPTAYTLLFRYLSGQMHPKFSPWTQYMYPSQRSQRSPCHPPWSHPSSNSSIVAVRHCYCCETSLPQ